MISPSLGKKIEAAGLNIALVEQRVSQALAEDAHAGDLTSKATIPASQISKASFNARKSGTIAGTLVAAAVLEECGLTNYEIKIVDGTLVEAGTTLIMVEGNTRAILLAERTALNFLSHLSGIRVFKLSLVIFPEVSIIVLTGIILLPAKNRANK